MDLDVLNMFLVAGGTLLIPILAFVTSFFLWPAALIQIYYWYWRRALGMQLKHVTCGNYTFCYTSRGRPGPKPSILMLHGFSAHKDMWLALVKGNPVQPKNTLRDYFQKTAPMSTSLFLPKNFHLICVDLPGHEGTTRSPLDDYSIMGQVKRIHQFVESINLNKRPFHLIGTSMGGCIAGVYAATYPKDLCSASLICPAGLQYPSDSKFLKHLKDLKESGSEDPKIPLIPSTAQEMEQMLKLCSYVRFKIPQQVLQGLIDVRIPHNEFYKKLFSEIVSEESRHILHKNMKNITVPTQIIWGRQDQVLDVSGAEVLSTAIPGSQLEILENCGHSVVMERPRKSAKLIVDFISSLQTTENNKKHD